jgi:hypothetical protein
MEISSKDRETLERLEEELWREETRFDLQRTNSLLLTSLSLDDPGASTKDRISWQYRVKESMLSSTT